MNTVNGKALCDLLMKDVFPAHLSSIHSVNGSRSATVCRPQYGPLHLATCHFLHTLTH